MLLASDPALGHLRGVRRSGRGRPGAALLDPDPGLAGFSADGFTPLHLAAYFGQTQWLEFSSIAGPTRMLCRAVRWPYGRCKCRGEPALGIVTRLLDHGAEVNAKQHGGWTPLHAAAFNGDLPMAGGSSCVRHGPVPASDDGKTPLDVAVEKGHEPVANWLRGHTRG